MFKNNFISGQGASFLHLNATASRVVNKLSAPHLPFVLNKLLDFAHASAVGSCSILSRQCSSVTHVIMVLVQRGRIPGTLSCSEWYVDIRSRCTADAQPV